MESDEESARACDDVRARPDARSWVLNRHTERLPPLLSVCVFPQGMNDSVNALPCWPTVHYL